MSRLLLVPLDDVVVFPGMSLTLAIEAGGAKISIGGVEFSEMPLATYVGILLNLVLPRSKELEGNGHPAVTLEAPDV